MRLLVCMIVVSLMVFPIVGALSLEPILAGDDAGSGRDAGVGPNAVPVLPGIVYGGSIRDAYEDRGDDYTFAASAGDVLRFAQSDTNLLCWYLVAPTGEDAVLNCLTGTNVVELTQTGTYVLHAIGTAGNDYEFAFSLDGSTPPYLPYFVQDDAGLRGDAPQDAPFAAPTATGVVLRGFIDGDLNDVADVYSVQVAEGQAIEAKLAAPGACLLLYAPDATLVESECGGPGQAATVHQAGAAAGRWLVKVDLIRPAPDLPRPAGGLPIPVAQDYAFSVALDAAAPTPSLG